MSSFAGVSFKVILEDDAFYPAPVRGDDRIPHYRANILIPNHASYLALQTRMTTATFKVASASWAINTTIETGYGPSTLTIPAYVGTLKAYTAVLVGLEAFGTAWYNSGFYRASADWVITSTITE